MAFPFAGDIDVMLRDLGVDVTVAGVTVKGLFDEPDSLELNTEAGTLFVRGRSLLLKTGALPGLAVGVTAVVDGVSRRVEELRQVDDGALTRVFLAGKP